MKLVRPNILPVQPLHSRAQRAVHVTLIGHHPGLAGVRAQGLGQIVQRGHRRERRPAHLQSVHGGLGLLFALGDDADEVANHHDFFDARQVRNRGLVH